MERYLTYPDNHQECFIYNGCTEIERIVRQDGRIVDRNWLLFDSISEAEVFFNDCADDGDFQANPIH